MRMPALAVVGADHQIIRSTESWRRKYESAVVLCERAPELDLVLNGQADAAVVDLGEISVSIEAVTDGAGKRQAMLSLPAEDLQADPESPLSALREAADESPALVWAKDLDGRYLYANSRYLSELEVSEERLLGNTDADLPAGDTVDGPRLRYIEDGLEEPLQLEYSVPEYESRPPMVAFRFALRNRSGKPVGTCGVAAPNRESQVAREEAVRLMQLERWNRLDPLDVRAEVLEQWHVQARPGPVPQLAPEPAPLELERNGKRAARAGADSVPDADNGHVAVTPVDEELIATGDGTVVNGDAAEEPESPAPGELAASEDAIAPPQPDREPAQVQGRTRTEQERALRVVEDDYRREEEWVRQLRQTARLSPQDAASETGGALHTDLQLARKWAERANQLQGDLHEAHARIQAAEIEAQRAAAAVELAEEETIRYRAEVEELRHQLEREKGEAHAARSEVEAARRELAAARAQAESLRGPADAALRLTDELGRALAAEQERGDELARSLARIRSRLEDLDGALDRSQPAAPGL